MYETATDREFQRAEDQTLNEDKPQPNDEAYGAAMEALDLPEDPVEVPVPATYWHRKGGGFYRFRWLAEAVFFQDAGELSCKRVVVYCNVESEHSIYVRERNEFFDLFEPVIE